MTLYPVWLRAWHGANALLFVLLVATGVSLHYASPTATIVPFALARAVHNAAGLLITAGWLAFVALNSRTGNLRHYVRFRAGWVGRGLRQARWYVSGIFRGRPHPFHPSARAKFNPLQQAAYLAVMYGWFPVSAATGLLLMFPELAPARVLGWGGVWPMAVLHLVLGFFGTLFLAGHVYLATTGATPAENFVTMIRGDAPRRIP